MSANANRKRKEDEGEATYTFSYQAHNQSFEAMLSTRLADKNWFVYWGEVVDFGIEPIVKFLINATLSNIPMVTLAICSPGGSTDDARGLVGVMEMCKAQGLTIRTIGAGYVASAGFDIFIAGTKGERYIHEMSMLMTHASSADLRNKREIKLAEYFDEKTLSTYTKIHKATREKFLETGDWFMSPEEAIKYGVADHLIQLGQALPSTPENTRNQG